jgi:integrase
MQHTETEDRAFDTVGISVFTSLRAGVHPRVVQERLGHSTIAVTLQVYSHVSPTLHDEAADLVAGQLLG